MQVILPPQWSKVHQQFSEYLKVHSKMMIKLFLFITWGGSFMGVQWLLTIINWQFFVVVYVGQYTSTTERYFNKKGGYPCGRQAVETVHVDTDKRATERKLTWPSYNPQITQSLNIHERITICQEEQCFIINKLLSALGVELDILKVCDSKKLDGIVQRVFCNE